MEEWEWEREKRTFSFNNEHIKNTNARLESRSYLFGLHQDLTSLAFNPKLQSPLQAPQPPKQSSQSSSSSQAPIPKALYCSLNVKIVNYRRGGGPFIFFGPSPPSFPNAQPSNSPTGSDIAPRATESNHGEAAPEKLGRGACSRGRP